MNILDVIPYELINAILDFIINRDNELTIFTLFQVSKEIYELSRSIVKTKYKCFATTSNRLLLRLFSDIETIDARYNSSNIFRETIYSLTNLRCLSLGSWVGYDFNKLCNLTELVTNHTINSCDITQLTNLKSLCIPATSIYLTTLTSLQKLKIDEFPEKSIPSIINVNIYSRITDLDVDDEFPDVGILSLMNLTSLSVRTNEQLPYLPFLTRLHWNTNLEVSITHTCLKVLDIGILDHLKGVMSIDAPLLEKLTVHQTSDMINLSHLTKLKQLHWNTYKVPSIIDDRFITYRCGGEEDYGNETVMTTQHRLHLEGMRLVESLTHITKLNLYDCVLSANTLISLTNLTKLVSTDCIYEDSISCLVALRELVTERCVYNIDANDEINSLSKLNNLTSLKSDIAHDPVRRMNIGCWYY